MKDLARSLFLLALVLALVLVLILVITGNQSEKPEEPEDESLGSFVEEPKDDPKPDTPAPNPETPEETPETPEVPDEEADNEENKDPEETPEEDPEENPDESDLEIPENVTEAEDGDLPEEQPEEEPEESEPQQPESAFLGSGSLRSDTGVYLNLIAAWSAETTGSNTVNLKVDVIVESYALRCGAAYGALKLTVDGSTVVLDMPAINVEGQILSQTHVVSRTYTVNLAKGQSANVEIAAEWFFGGQYSGTQLDTISCSGTAYLAR